ncbi:hypothetical protein FD51_GL000317 [Lacticaseibacillus zeae DSM 20178 = KCTC 3804]|uniref:Serine protease n=1 Tax=Lacticaseibacillus zeae DSM 20178 = KCTC 3804 TaxID=1423816 RepID=A0A0R1F3X0_LACZE|nr:trypsin-like peptidase domain-containing protein [Lacticaseibacillus zeae]KRK13754.1 hypothetical protein FD51_GL000317 [Lacticaseibacillus zeae DSM 20178 = KCTC 3804]OLS11499.1 hypothetical protein AUQ39_00725 [Lacticaseibacillus casei]QVI33271.1 trypsin-like peptidase domain-containing protein [Lacticaseibacillus zeae]
MEVTGVVVNEKVNVSRRYERRVRAILHNFQISENYDDTSKKFFKYYNKGDQGDPAQIVKGMISFIYQIRQDPLKDSALSRRLMQEFNQIKWPDSRHFFDLKIAMPQRYKRYNAVFSVEVKKGENIFYGTAFACGDKIYSCTHIFTDQKRIEDIDSVEMVEYNPQTKEEHKRYKVTKIEYWPNFDVSVLTILGNKDWRKRGFKHPTHILKPSTRLLVVGYPYVNQIGKSYQLYEARERIESMIDAPLQMDEFTLSLSNKEIKTRKMDIITNEKGGIQSGNSGGPVLDANGDTVVGIALRGSLGPETTRSEMLDFYSWMNLQKPRSRIWNWEKAD